MAYVVTDLCVDCKYTTCAAVCPVEAFRGAPRRLLIDPEVCIDCNACVPECPVEAIFADFDVPERFRPDIELAIREASKYPPINQAKQPLQGPRCSAPGAG